MNRHATAHAQRHAQSPAPRRAPRFEWQPVSARQRWLAALLLAVVGAVLAWLAFNHPRSAPLPLRCPSLAVLGVYCPGCGSTRATHHALRGELARAWRHNPALLLIGLPVGTWFVAVTAIMAIAARRVTLRVPTALAWILLALLLGYMLVRNIPSSSLAWMRPPDALDAAGGHGREPVAKLIPSNAS